MPLDISQFRQAQAAADQSSIWLTSQNGQELVHGSGNADQNKAVMQSFVASIRQSYGDSCANMAERALDIPGGMALTSRRIADVLKMADARKAIQGNNSLLALRFAEDTSNQTLSNFGQLFADAAAPRGLELLAEKYDTRSLSASIRNKIASAGQGGAHLVTATEASGIAKACIEEFLDSYTKAAEEKKS